MNMRNKALSLGLAGLLLVPASGVASSRPATAAQASRGTTSPSLENLAQAQEAQGLPVSDVFNGMYEGEKYQAKTIFSDGIVFSPATQVSDSNYKSDVTYFAKGDANGNISELSALYTMSEAATGKVIARIKWSGKVDADGKLRLTKEYPDVSGGPSANQTNFYQQTSGNNLVLDLTGRSPGDNKSYFNVLTGAMNKIGQGKNAPAITPGYDPIPVK